MAKKSKKRTSSAARRPSGPAAGRGPVAGTGTATQTPKGTLGDIDEAANPTVSFTTPAATVSGEAAAVAPVRRVARATPGAVRRPARGSSGQTFEPLESADDAIPYNRVPYFAADLRRVGVIACLMVVLICITTVLVRTLVK